MKLETTLPEKQGIKKISSCSENVGERAGARKHWHSGLTLGRYMRMATCLVECCIIILATGAIPYPSTNLNSFGIVSMLQRSGRLRKVFRTYRKYGEVIDSRLGYLAEILLVGFDSGTKAVTRMVLQLDARQRGPKRYLPR